MRSESLTDAVKILKKAQNVVAMTGAGISTPSGIPDFRSRASGVWNTLDPMEVASLRNFRYNPLSFYDWLRPFVGKILEAVPNPAHRALSQLEQLGMLKALITQNIDMLHAQAGQQIIWEVHGHVRQMTCISCFKEYDAYPFLMRFLQDDKNCLPRCLVCQGVLKPDVVLFGEELPRTVMQAAQKAVRSADAILVAGTSLEVHPVGDFPRQVKANGGKVILINDAPTHFDAQADVILRGDVAEVLPDLVKALVASNKII